MNEMLTMERPSVMDDQMTDAYLGPDLAGELEAPYTLPLAYEAGHSAVIGANVEIDLLGTETHTRPPEAHAAELAAETWRNFSPFNKDNDAVFGGPEGRLAAMETVRGVANQAQITGKYFDGRHKFLGRQLAAGEITQEAHDEAVGEIAATMVLTNPAHLQNVGEAQRAAIARRVRGGLLPAETQFVDVVSRVTTEGVQLAGLDAVVARMTGASNQAELAQTGLDIKRRTYGEDAYIKAGQRYQAQQTRIAAAVAAQQEFILRDILDREAAQAKAKTDEEE
jgi:hypothetical protein